MSRTRKTPVMLSSGHSFPEGNHYCDSVCSMTYESCVQWGGYLAIFVLHRNGIICAYILSLKIHVWFIHPVAHSCRSFIWIALSISYRIISKSALDGPGHVQSFNRGKSVNLKKYRNTEQCKRRDWYCERKQARHVLKRKRVQEKLTAFKFNTWPCLILETVSSGACKLAHVITNLEIFHRISLERHEPQVEK